MNVSVAFLFKLFVCGTALATLFEIVSVRADLTMSTAFEEFAKFCETYNGHLQEMATDGVLLVQDRSPTIKVQVEPIQEELNGAIGKAMRLFETRYGVTTKTGQMEPQQMKPRWQNGSLADKVFVEFLKEDGCSHTIACYRYGSGWLVFPDTLKECLPQADPQILGAQLR